MLRMQSGGWPYQKKLIEAPQKDCLFVQLSIKDCRWSNMNTICLVPCHGAPRYTYYCHSSTTNKCGKVELANILSVYDTSSSLNSYVIK